MRTALIGYTGFVGSNIIEQYAFQDLYNSTNINAVRHKIYDLIVCAGVRAEKWRANLFPKEDKENIIRLIENLKDTKSKKFVLISTVDIYPHPYNVNENTKINKQLLPPYGEHRLLLEEFIKSNFPNSTIMRLPGLFGKGIKKNFIYDLIHTHRLDLTHYESQFQFYNLRNIWKDIMIALNQSISLINLVSEPIKAKDVAQYLFGIEFLNKTKNPPLHYNVHTIHAQLYKSSHSYIYYTREILQELKQFITIERKKIQ